MSFLSEYQAVITPAKVEPRTSKAGDPYWLITDRDGGMWAQWDNEKGNEQLVSGKKYAVFYKQNGKYKNIIRNLEVKNEHL